MERAHGGALAFILAQFIPSWISIPVCVLLILAYGTSPVLHAQRLRDAVLQRLAALSLGWVLRPSAPQAPLRPSAPQAPPHVTMDIPVAEPTPRDFFT